MRVLHFVFVILIAYGVSALPLLEDKDDFQYPRFIMFPDGDGNPHLVDLEEPIDEEHRLSIERNDDINRYFLYTRRNHHNTQELIMNNVGSIQSSNFNPSLPTIVIVHGWLSKAETDLNPAIRDAYLGRFDVNLIILDWRVHAIGGYVTAANAVPGVGTNLGRFLQFLHGLGSSYNTMHLAGFSLGAHVVGSAGRHLNGAVGRITGMDPAGPLWTLSNNRISPGDAQYVEAIHTDGGYTVGGLGIGRDVADVDFYPNGGLSQPGCLTNICNHNRAWLFFSASVSYNHLIGNRCESSTQINMNLCRGPEFPLGNGYTHKSGSGRFRVNTGRRYPFGNVDD